MANDRYEQRQIDQMLHMPLVIDDENRVSDVHAVVALLKEQM